MSYDEKKRDRALISILQRDFEERGEIIRRYREGIPLPEVFGYEMVIGNAYPRTVAMHFGTQGECDEFVKRFTAVVKADTPTAANAGGLVTGTGQPAIGPTWARNADGGLHFVGAPTATSAASQDINEMVNRFLGWKLPDDFAPDCGISFKRESDYEHQVYGRNKFEPVGTNLFTADQAKAMFEYCLRPAATNAGCEAAGLHKPKQT